MRCCAFKPVEIHLYLQIFSAVVFAGVRDLWVWWFLSNTTYLLQVIANEAFACVSLSLTQLASHLI
jgi:hypothetical protein